MYKHNYNFQSSFIHGQTRKDLLSSTVYHFISYHGIYGCMDINRKHWVDSMEMIPWKSNAPWIPQKLSVESMETHRKRRKLMPLNFPLNVHCFVEVQVHGNGVRILNGSDSGIHGIPWKSHRREWFTKCTYYQMYFE